ncbi:hypothetical protein LTR74_001789 [Friedmanniomyces endolithicus]|nr:hypothetical protein LTR74_001789 [Friedmanniomyces endolithicus]
MSKHSGSAKTGLRNAWKRLSPGQLNIAIQLFSLISIFFEGYDQGVMGGVNAAPDYVRVVNIGQYPSGTVTNQTKQGGIISIYYLGALVGCFLGGWAADRIGRINGLFCAAIFALVGGALQAATQSATFILLARTLTGIGTGALTGITPVLIAEMSRAEHRGGFLGYVFIANYLGISVAYWLSFGLAFVDNGLSAVRWRFLLAFQCFPAIILLCGIRLLPDSPRYLASVGRYEEAKEVLEHVRGSDGEEVQREYKEICAVSQEATRTSPVEFAKVLCGLDNSLAPHLGRRQAGYSAIKQNGLAGGLNTIGIVGTIISAHIVDRLGRRKCLIWGAFGLFVVNLVAAALYEASRGNAALATSIAPAAVTMLFLFNLIYASTWGTVAFLIPTEIFPPEMRAQGNGFGVSGWALGVGWTVLINPIMFAHLESRTYFLFAGLNLLWMPIIFFFYPETKDRSLESIDAMFSSPTPFYRDMEKAYAAGADVLAMRGMQHAEMKSAMQADDER